MSKRVTSVTLRLQANTVDSDGEVRREECAVTLHQRAVGLARANGLGAEAERLWRMLLESVEGTTCPLCREAEDGRELCLAKRGAFKCTRARGHVGEHTACGDGHDGHPVARWP